MTNVVVSDPQLCECFEGSECLVKLGSKRLIRNAVALKKKTENNIFLCLDIDKQLN